MDHHVLSSVLPEGPQLVSAFSSSENDEIWREAENETAELLGQIQPSRSSEDRRRSVINYIKQLIEQRLSCKVFSFGSVPLKTYLPDGDIDLTVIRELHCFNGAWAKDVSAILEHEEKRQNAEFRVKEVKCISAEVPVVKCLVEDIIVDITLNQLGGLSTLCFLEEVDRLIGKDHLFKKSIILVKAWCFYESRILGAHHGLLSTYALEVLVLYIFHVFHHFLRGPLEVLFRFLQFFSKFDWEKYCLSLWGPVPLVSLHSMTVDPHQGFNGSFLLSESYLNSCRDKYSTPFEMNQGKTFSRKFMNLVDPLRPFNNLGRSVNSGNLARMYSAFTLGATQLEKLLKSSKENVSENLAAFFRNTRQRPDVGILGFQGLSHLHHLRPKDQENDRLEANASLEEVKDLTKTTKKHAKQGNVECSDAPAHENADFVLDDTQHSIAYATSGEAAGNEEDGLFYSGDLLMPLRNEMGKCREVESNNLFNNLHKHVNEEHSFSSSQPESFFGNSILFEELKARNQPNGVIADTATPIVLSVCSSEAGGDGSAEASSTKEQLSEEEAQIDQMEEGLMNQMQAFEFRDTDAAILEGDYTVYLCNLEAGRQYYLHGSTQNAFGSFNGTRMFRGSAWEGPGRPLPTFPGPFAQVPSGRNRVSHVPIHGGSSQPINGFLADSFPKQQKGTGTFLPNLRPGFERDKRILANGVRSLRRPMGGMDSVNSSGHTTSPVSWRSRSNMLKKQEGSNRLRAKKGSDGKMDEPWEVLTEDGMLQSPTMQVMDQFEPIKRNVEGSGASANEHKVHSMDGFIQPLNATLGLTYSNNQELPLEQLEFGSFGPGFLIRGVQKSSTSRDDTGLIQQHPSSRDRPSEHKEALPKAGAHDHQQQSAHNMYELKEEDFPPLPFANTRELSNSTADNKSAASSPTQGSYHQACLHEYPLYATKSAQMR